MCYADGIVLAPARTVVHRVLHPDVPVLSHGTSRSDTGFQIGRADVSFLLCSLIEQPLADRGAGQAPVRAHACIVDFTARSWKRTRSAPRMCWGVRFAADVPQHFEGSRVGCDTVRHRRRSIAGLRALRYQRSI